MTMPNTLDAETLVSMKKIEVEAANNRSFFHDRRYLDTGEPVGDNEFWLLKITEKDAPFEREQGYTWFYALEQVENFPVERIDRTNIDKIRLDQAEPDETGNARFKITETNSFDHLNDLIELTE